jgi:D-lactate dehydrogenase (cytochrome)
MESNLIKEISKEHEAYLRDESRICGHAQLIAFPKTPDELKEILRSTSIEKLKVTVQGARTGITAGAVPYGGLIINLSKMDKITGLRFDKAKNSFFLKVQPGVLLEDIREGISKKKFQLENWTQESKEIFELFKKSENFFFPPDPTEPSASIGGMVACNASGACSFYYGPTRDYVETLKLLLEDGSTIELRRGEQKSNDKSFALQTKEGRNIRGSLPFYKMPEVKNASGYFVEENMDLIDLFIGSEGTLGVITELEIRLVKAPKTKNGIVVFFCDENKALSFVREIRREERKNVETSYGEKLAAIEFFNYEALKLIRKLGEVNPMLKRVGELPEHFHSAVYLEYHLVSEVKQLESLYKVGEVIKSCGGNEKDTWVAMNSSSMESLHFFRHAVPEAVNMIIDERKKLDPRISKLGTDMAVPDNELENIISLYNSTLKETRLQSVMFGHIGNNHIHVNILPNSMEEYSTGKKLYLGWADKVVEMKGSVSAEHGIGKLKVSFLKKMYGSNAIEDMRKLKAHFDPDKRLNPGNLFEEKEV